MGCHSLVQGIIPTQGLNLRLLNCRQILYCLSHQGSPLVELIIQIRWSCFRTCALNRELHCLSICGYKHGVYTTGSKCVCSVMSDSLAPLSMGLTRQEYWRGLAFPSPGDLPDPGMELRPVTFMRPKINQPISWKKNAYGNHKSKITGESRGC